MRRAWRSLIKKSKPPLLVPGREGNDGRTL